MNDSSSMPQRSIYVGIRFNSSTMTWQFAESGAEASNIPWCNVPEIRQNVMLANSVGEALIWQSFPQHAAIGSTVCLKQIHADTNPITHR